jgi:hypothetical protein
MSPLRPFASIVFRSVVLALFMVALRVASAQETPPAETPAAEPPPEAVEQLPKLQDLPIPSAEELLVGKPRDWIVLPNDFVLIVEPVAPRPDTVAKLEQEYNTLLRQKPGKKDEELEELNRQLEELKYLLVTLPDDKEVPEYRLPLKQVRQVLYHEDLILKRVDLLIAEQNIDVALELQILLERTYAQWPGIAERRNLLIMADARKQMESGQAESALVLLEGLFLRNNAQPGLIDLVQQAVAELVDEAWQRRDVGRVQHFLGRLKKVAPQGTEAKRITDLLSSDATRLLGEADQAAAARDYGLAALKAEDAARTWPELSDLKVRHRQHLARHPKLHVAVTRLAGELTSYPFLPRAELRAREIEQCTLFEPDRMKGGSTFYRTRFFHEWEPFDLGRQVQFTLKTNRQPWEMQGKLAANECAAMLLRRIDPDDPAFDERMATCLESVRVNSPYVLTVTFSRVPSRIEPLLALVTTGLNDAKGAAPAADPEAAIEDGAGGFVVAEQDASRLIYRRRRPEPDGLPRYRTAEIVEQRYDSYDRAYQALLRGEVSMVADLPDWFVREIQQDDRASKEFFVQQSSVPMTQFLQANPRSKVMRNRELRRALSYAIQRDKILADFVLRDVKMSHGRVTDIPFPSSSDIASGRYPRFEYDFTAAIAMALAAANQLGGGTELPILKMACPPEPVERIACGELIKAWKRVGIVVEMVPDNDESGEWDLAYRSMQLTEPILELWPLLTAQDRARMSDLDSLPAWLQHDLVELDRITDFARAGDFTREILRKVMMDVNFIPLWEIDKFLILRKTIHDFPTAPLATYAQVDRWMIDPWYTTQLP